MSKKATPPNKAASKSSPTPWRGLKGKLRPWLRAYLDESNRDTFLNATASAKAAGYKADSYHRFGEIGYQNSKKLQKLIDQWMDEFGLSEAALKRKLKSLLEAKESKIITVKGRIQPEMLPEGCHIITEAVETVIVGFGEDAEAVDKVNTVLMINMNANELQRRTLDMGMKVRGMYVNEDKGVEEGLAKLGDRLAKAIERVAK